MFTFTFIFIYIFYPKIEIKDLVVLPERAHDFSKKKIGYIQWFRGFYE